MIDITEKDLLPSVLRIIAVLEERGYKVIAYKENYEVTKCFINGWQRDISHYADKPLEYIERILEPSIEMAEKLRSMGHATLDYDLPKYKGIRTRIEKRSR